MIKRKLSEIYIRAEVEGKWDAYSITDLDWNTIKNWLESKNYDYIKQVNDRLYKLFIEVCEQTNEKLAFVKVSNPIAQIKFVHGMIQQLSIKHDLRKVFKVE